MNSTEAVTAAEAFAARLQGMIAYEIEGEYPWMPKADVNKIAEDMAAVGRKGIVDQVPKLVATQKRMNIFELSAELRNMIYGMVLDNDSNNGEVTIQEFDESSNSTTAELFRGGFANVPALLQTSREVRKETQKLYYARTTFIAQVIYDEVHIVKEWLLKLSSESRGCIKKMIIEFPSDNLEGMHHMIITQMREEAEFSMTYARRMGLFGEGSRKPTKPRNARECLVEYLRLNLVGMKMEAFEIRCSMAADPEDKAEFPLEVIETLSDTALFCLGCDCMAEPEEGVFTKEGCEYCVDDEVEETGASS